MVVDEQHADRAGSRRGGRAERTSRGCGAVGSAATTRNASLKAASPVSIRGRRAMTRIQSSALAGGSVPDNRCDADRVPRARADRRIDRARAPSAPPEAAGSSPPGRRPGAGRGRRSPPARSTTRPGRSRRAVDGADLVVLAAPPLDCLALARRAGRAVAAVLGTGAIVTDVASTKGAIVRRATPLGVRFVGGHPMAGRETTGFGAGRRRRCSTIGPGSSSRAGRTADAVERSRARATACGAPRSRWTRARHDRLVAAISHLPLVVSAALVEAVAGTGAAAAPRLGVGGRRSRPAAGAT